MNTQLYNYYVIDRTNRKERKPCPVDFAEEFYQKGLSPEERMARRFEEMCKLEIPAIHPMEKIVLRRTVSTLPDCFTKAEWREIKSQHYVHELGYVSNLSPNYATTISKGFLALMDGATEYQQRMMNAIIGLCDRYKDEAVAMGLDDVAQVLTRVPRYGAQTFREALQFFRILHYSLWLEGDYHNTVGRFDQYMYPYYKKDIENGTLTNDEALELVEDFFLSFNKDSDLYNGVIFVLGEAQTDLCQLCCLFKYLDGGL